MGYVNSSSIVYSLSIPLNDDELESHRAFAEYLLRLCDLAKLEKERTDASFNERKKQPKVSGKIKIGKDAEKLIKSGKEKKDGGDAKE